MAKRNAKREREDELNNIVQNLLRHLLSSREINPNEVRSAVAEVKKLGYYRHDLLRAVWAEVASTLSYAFEEAERIDREKAERDASAARK